MTSIDLERNFFAREDMLELLKKRVLGLKEGYRQNVALLGNRYMGKSAILKHFVTNLDDDKVTIVYLDLENKDFHYFFYKFTGSILYHYSKNHDLPLHDELPLLMESVENAIPHTIQVIRKIRKNLNNNKVNEAFLGLLALPEVYTNESGQFCVLILDEFQDLEKSIAPEAFQKLGRKIMTQTKCFYILASTYPELAQKILSERLSLLFGNFEVVNIEPFDLQTSQQFIEHNLKNRKLGVQLSNFLTDFTGGHPLYLNLICQELINLSSIYDQNEIYMPLLSQSIENCLFNRWGVLSRHFELIMNEICAGKGDEVNATILMTMANGNHKIEDIIEKVAIKKTHTKQRVNRLMELGIIVKNGNFHYFQDKLFKYWIKYIYQSRLKDVELAPDKLKRQFKDELNRLVENFKISSRRDFSLRVVELLHCFENESFNINGKKYRLPIFKDVVPYKLRNESGNFFDVIKASTGDSTWFVLLKKDNLGEPDVDEVLADSKRMGLKPEKCMLISLTDVEEHTKLRALQEKFWIWQEGELNTLLTLYDKPFIMR